VSGLNTLFERNKKKKRLPNFIIEKKCKKLNLPMYEDFDTIEYILQKETNV
jgi:hypothetical protein